MKSSAINDFGIVDPDGDRFEFHYGTGAGAVCVLEAVVQTERGPKRTELAAIPASLWRKVSIRAVRELAAGMGESERTKKTPTLMTGTNRLSPLVGRELAVLLWALIEDDAGERIEPILHGWRELAREERWWLFARASAPGQRKGAGWRRALFDALSEPTDTRPMQETAAEKKPFDILVQLPFGPEAAGKDNFPVKGKPGTRGTTARGKKKKAGQGGKTPEGDDNEAPQVKLF